MMELRSDAKYSSVILNSRPPGAPTAISHVDLVPDAPWCVLIKFGAFVVHVSSSEIIFDETSDRTVFHKGRQDLYWEAEEGRHATDV